MNYIQKKDHADEERFVGLVRQVVKKHGIPERVFIEADDALIVMTNNQITVLPASRMACLKKVDRFFRDITSTT